MPKVDICTLNKKMCLEISTLHQASALAHPSKTKEQALL
jgi:hypothetical protein